MLQATWSAIRALVFGWFSAMQLDELAAVQAARRAARGARLRPATGGGWILVLWGAVWLVGYLLQALGNPQVGLYWTAVPALAVLVSFGVGFRMRHFVQASWGRQLAGLWGLWVLFAAAWVALFLPPTRPEGQAFIVSLVAFALSISGLMVGRPLVLAGLGLFIWDVLVYLAWPAAFPWAMMAVGAAALLGGVFLLRWKPASTS